MKKLTKLFTIIFVNAICIYTTHAQCSGWTNLQLERDTFLNIIYGNATTPEIDKLGRPYIYLATTTGGIKVFDVSTPGEQTLVNTIDTSLLGGLSAINLRQDSVYLYASLGNIWSGSTDEAGLAIIDISTPSNPLVMDVYAYPGSVGGAGDVALQDHYAYLGAMGSGLVVLDIANKNNIQLVSQLPFLNNFPHSPPMTGGPELYNARSIALQDTFAYVCYDRGGLRVVSIADPAAPYQVSQYAFGDLIDHATAYNNVVVYDTLAFVTIDYYGVEVLNISDPYNITQLGWWHPSTWAPATNDILVWSNANGHANELAFDANCNMLYVAAGKSDLVALNVSDPANPTDCEIYGTTTDDYGTWGMDLYQDHVCIGYIWSPVAPPHSNYSGFRELLITPCSTGIGVDKQEQNNITVYPNPSTDELNINSAIKIEHLEIYDIYGRFISSTTTTGSSTINISGLAEGTYILNISTVQGNTMFKFVKE